MEGGRNIGKKYLGIAGAFLGMSAALESQMEKDILKLNELGSPFMPQLTYGGGAYDKPTRNKIEKRRNRNKIARASRKRNFR